MANPDQLNNILFLFAVESGNAKPLDAESNRPSSLSDEHESKIGSGVESYHHEIPQEEELVPSSKDESSYQPSNPSIQRLSSELKQGLEDTPAEQARRLGLRSNCSRSYAHRFGLATFEEMEGYQLSSFFEIWICSCIEVTPMRRRRV